jgi:hypothetical protein
MRINGTKAMTKYRSFDEVLKELEMDEDELKRLVSEGQIRAFRDEDRMKFRAEDVNNLASTRQKDVGEQVDLGETQVGGEGLQVVEEETDETLLDLGNLSGDKDFEDTGATSVPTVELSDVGGGEDQDATLTEELVFDETDELGGLDFGEGSDADATQKIETGGLDLKEGEDLGLQTEPVEALDELDEAPVQHAPPPSRVAGPPMGMPGPVQIQEQIKYVEIVPNEGIVWKVLTGVTFILFLFALCTFPIIGLGQSDDVLGNFWGQTGYNMYLKGKNQQIEIQQAPYRMDLSAPGAKNAPIPVAVGTKAEHIVWPGQDIIRKFSGESVSSASGSETGGGDAAKPDAAKPVGTK